MRWWQIGKRNADLERELQCAVRSACMEALRAE
jgi:hypothetical protein